MSALFVDIMSIPNELRPIYYQRLLLLTGFTILIQTAWGHRLPIPDGPASALVITVAAYSSQDAAMVGGGMILAGGLVFCIGFFGLLKYVTPLFTNRIVGVILILISLTILPFIVPMLAGINSASPRGSPAVLLVSLTLILGMTFMNHYCRGIGQSLSIFWAIVLGTLIFALWGKIETDAIVRAHWFTPPTSLWQKPEFSFTAFLSFSLAYLAVLVNAVGSFIGVKTNSEPRPDGIKNITGRILDRFGRNRRRTDRGGGNSALFHQPGCDHGYRRRAYPAGDRLRFTAHCIGLFREIGRHTFGGTGTGGGRGP